jgi:hypothetical protein
MRRLCLLVAVVMIHLLILATNTTAQAPPSATINPPSTCHVTKPNGRKVPWQTFESPGQRQASPFWEYNEWHGNKAESTFLPRNGVFVLQPGRNITLENGTLVTKFMWFKVRKPLTLEGHRLDGNAPPAWVGLALDADGALLQPSQVGFPTPGCWQITSTVGHERLKIVLWVVFDSPATTQNR